MNNALYLHTLKGRIRIKVPEVKGSRSNASTVEHALWGMDGITSVQANPTTGNVLVHYDPDVLTQTQVLKALRRLGCLKRNHRTTASLTHQLGNKLVGYILEEALEIAVKRLIMAAI